MSEGRRNREGVKEEETGCSVKRGGEGYGREGWDSTHVQHCQQQFMENLGKAWKKANAN